MKLQTVLVVLAISFTILVSCQQKKEIDTTPPVIEVTAKDYSFQGVPDTLKAGWTTFKLVNEGKEPHFFLLDAPPEGKSMQDFIEEVSVPFDSTWYRLRDGEINKQEAGQMLGETLPEWYFSTEQVGGTGIITPGTTAQTTLYLEPGYYIMECYVKTTEGEFHVSVGMAEDFTVIEDTTQATAPGADYEITLTNSEISTQGELSTGKQTIAVHFKEHPEVGVGNDIHLAKVTDETNMDSLKLWMDWMEVQGLAPPAPAEFIGGTQEMPVGNTAYFTVDLEPGDYTWLTETPGNVRAKQFEIANSEEQN